ncbi:microsomal signal peptidase subunit 3 [[Candida] jaroonii]|uniref:Microsomal signal peptidase subunit 3 n=1 Tax=[Candida] jaroonii TaxID=467808 RepID=A0ACA9YG14_9ASCO|nr:microsomal signal peptidase subunit 3 [[Candida] jaroonii]
MFNLVSRAQAVSNHVLTCSMILGALVAISSLIQLYSNNVWGLNNSIENIKANASLKNSFQYGSKNGKPKENSIIKFDLETDLSSLFNWNTKQVFVYLTAEYPGKSEESYNKVTYWDKIITNKEDAKIKLSNQRAKYSVWDVEDSFRSRIANLTLEWNVQPHIGPLIYGKTVTKTPFTFAEVKTKKTTNNQ